MIRWLSYIFLICLSTQISANNPVDSIPPQLYLIGDTLCPEDNYMEAVRVKDFSLIRSFQFQLRWDASALSLDSFWAAAPFAANIFFNDQELSQGKLNAVWFYPIIMQGLSLPDGDPLVFYRFVQVDSLIDRSMIRIDTTDQSFPLAFTQLSGDTSRMIIGIGKGDSLVFSDPEISDIVITPSASGQQTGTIKLELKGGKPPYFVTWNTGATGQELSDLGPGNYSCTISDENNCERVFGPFVVDQTTGLVQNPYPDKLVAFPNPFSNQINVQSSTLIRHVEIIDLQGKTVFNYTKAPFLEKSFAAELLSLAKGIFLMKLTHIDGRVFYLRIVKI